MLLVILGCFKVFSKISNIHLVPILRPGKKCLTQSSCMIKLHQKYSYSWPFIQRSQYINMRLLFKGRSSYNMRKSWVLHRNSNRGNRSDKICRIRYHWSKRYFDSEAEGMVALSMTYTHLHKSLHFFSNMYSVQHNFTNTNLNTWTLSKNQY